MILIVTGNSFLIIKEAYATIRNVEDPEIVLSEEYILTSYYVVLFLEKLTSDTSYPFAVIVSGHLDDPD